MAAFRARALCKAFRQLDLASTELLGSCIKGSSSRSGLDALLIATQRSWFRCGALPQTRILPSKTLPHKRCWSMQQRDFAVAAPQATPADEDVVLTDRAIEKLQELCNSQADQHLRLTVEAGGCSGFSYKFDLDTSLQEGDRIFEAGGVKLVADSMSFEFVRGAKVDYCDELIKASFEVIDNPNAEKGCGCGTSFSPK